MIYAHSAPDPFLDELLGALGPRVRRRGHGRVFVEINVHGHRVTGVRVHDDPLTWEDLEQMMTELPRGWRR